MLTTFDRYLFKSFFYTLAVCCIGALGVFFVFDAFTNADEFLKLSSDGAAWPVARRMMIYYACQACLFLGTVGHVLCLISVMIVLVVIQRSGELHPVLAAGVPLYRIVTPLVLGAALVNAAIMTNQEVVIPRIAHLLQTPRSRAVKQGVSIRPTLDLATHVLISAERLFPQSSKLSNAEFVLPVPNVVERLTTIRAQTAKYVRKGPGGRSGWLLAGMTPSLEELPLAASAERVLEPSSRAGVVFVVSGVTPDQLADKSGTTRFLSTPDLVRRIRNPSQTARSAHDQILALHSRLTRPLLNICAVLLAVPFLVRRERSGLVANLALCGAVMLVLLGFSESCLFLADLHVLSPDVAAWSPIVVCGTCAVWCSRHAET